MASFICYSLLDQEGAQFAYDGIRKWFKDHPDKNECVTEFFVVRRKFIKKDILKNSKSGVTIK